MEHPNPSGNISISIQNIIDKLKSSHADKVFVGKEYTKQDLIRELERTNNK